MDYHSEINDHPMIVEVEDQIPVLDVTGLLSSLNCSPARKPNPVIIQGIPKIQPAPVMVTNHLQSLYLPKT